MEDQKEEERSMRQLWFDHVRKTRAKVGTKKNPCSHRDAMKVASTSWPKLKNKIEKKRARVKKI